MRKFLFISALIVFASCEKEIPLDVDEIAPRIVVNSIFSAGDTIWLQLSESRDVIYDGDLPNLTTAEAKLLDENQNVLGTFTHQSEGSYYLADVYPEVGSSYGLSVSNSGFETVTATSKTPQIVEIISIDTVTKSNYLEMDITFTDDGSQQNYYSVTIINFEAYFDEFGEIVEYWEYPYICTDEIIPVNGGADWDGEKCADEFYFTDETFNGTNYTFKAKTWKIASEEGEVAAGVMVIVRSLSEDYFKYKLTYSKYLETQGSPFAEPVQVYSNIENGFGIFGGYSSAVSDTLIVL